MSHRSCSFLHPLSDDILLSWFFEAHEEMRDTLHFLSREFISKDIETIVDLHSISIYDGCAFCNPQCEFDREFRFSDASCSAYCNDGTKRSHDRPGASRPFLHPSWPPEGRPRRSISSTSPQHLARFTMCVHFIVIYSPMFSNTTAKTNRKRPGIRLRRHLWSWP